MIRGRQRTPKEPAPTFIDHKAIRNFHVEERPLGLSQGQSAAYERPIKTLKLKESTNCALNELRHRI
jgi:hypothetical protein